MMSWCFPDKISLVTTAYEIAYSFSCMLGSELGGYLYENHGFSLALNVTSKYIILFDHHIFVSLLNFFYEVLHYLAMIVILTSTSSAILVVICYLTVLLSTYWSDINAPQAAEDTPSLKDICFLPILVSFSLFKTNLYIINQRNL